MKNILFNLEHLIQIQKRSSPHWPLILQELKGEQSRSQRQKIKYFQRVKQYKAIREITVE